MSSKLTPQLRDMTLTDVDQVVSIEQQVHSHPWTRGMFIDALKHGNLAKVYVIENEIVGYTVLMPALDEVELLDLSIARAYQRQGFGENLLNKIIMLYKDDGMGRMTLEVRRSNVSAHALYRKTGFAEIGIRRNYYALAEGREDAIVMAKVLQ